MPDILIRMDMPQHCFNCSTKIDPDNRKCNIDGHIFEETLSKLTCRRDEDCPLHELPPHGDLIDRNELCDGLVSNHPVVIYAKTAPVVIQADKEDTE